MQNPLPQGGGFSRFTWQDNFSFGITKTLINRTRKLI